MMLALGKKYGVRLVTHIALIIGCLIMVYPFAVVLLTAFKTNNEIYQNPIGLPRHWVFENFIGAWNSANLGRLFLNSVFLTAVGVALAVFISALAAFAIARSTAAYKQKILLFFISGIFIPVQLSIIPLFRIIKQLGLFNTYAGVLCVYAAAGLPMGIYLLFTFMKGIPKELSEAADMDGCSYFKLFQSIYLPLIGPVISTYAILQSLSIWNDFLIPYLLLTDDTKRTLTTGIMSFRAEFVSNWGYLMAGVVIMVIPIMIAYLFAQRYIMKGITAGAIKG